MGNQLCQPPHEPIDPVLTEDIPSFLDDEEYEEMMTKIKKEPSSKMRLQFECKGLKKGSGDFDPIVFLFKCKKKDGKGGAFYDPEEVFKTEAVADVADPQFSKIYTFDYKFEEETYFQARIYNEVARNEPLEKQKIYGQANFTLSKLINAPDSKLKKPIMHSTKEKDKVGGDLIIVAKPIDASQPVSTVSFIPSINLFHYVKERVLRPGKDKVFLVICAQQEDGKYYPVLKTECQLAPNEQIIYHFNRIRTDSLVLANHDPESFFLVRSFHFREKGEAIKMATFQVKYKQLINNKTVLTRMTGTGDTMLMLYNCAVHDKISFLDYIFGGTEISLQIAVDMTKSNGNSSYEKSLHRISPEMKEDPEHEGWKQNMYYQALRSIAATLENYDSDKLIPMYGFGAILPNGEDHEIPMNKLEDGTEEKPIKWTSQCFAMNGDAANPQVKGVQGVLKTYRETTPLLDMWGPTTFKHFLRVINKQLDAIDAQQKQNSMKYTILLILTDGTIAEETQAKAEIIRASKLPVSIVIIGVGKPEDDFKFMRELDADKVPLCLINNKTKEINRQERDCVQFLSCNEYNNDPEKITIELLREIPDQITAYFDSKSLKPGPPDPNAQEKFLHSKPDPYFTNFTNNMVQEAVKNGADKAALEKLLSKEKNPDFRPNWMVLNAPKVTEEPGIQLNKIAAQYIEDEEAKETTKPARSNAINASEVQPDQ